MVNLLITQRWMADGGNDMRTRPLGGVDFWIGVGWKRDDDQIDTAVFAAAFIRNIRFKRMILGISSH